MYPNWLHAIQSSVSCTRQEEKLCIRTAFARGCIASESECQGSRKRIQPTHGWSNNAQKLGKGAHSIKLHILSALLRSAVTTFPRKCEACSGGSLGTFDFAPGQPQFVCQVQRPLLKNITSTLKPQTSGLPGKGRCASAPSARR